MARRQQNQVVPLNQALVLYHWMIREFGVVEIEQLATPEFKRSVYEGYTDENHTHYLGYLIGRKHTFSQSTINESLLRQWDANIVSHTLRISESRSERIAWKYFQYLGLLFTEFYLDWYFRDKDGLHSELNEYVRLWNSGLLSPNPNMVRYQAKPFAKDELNKLAFWSATGSGKTLLMHVNTLQYRHYLKLHDAHRTVNKILLVTPNEGLSIQHLDEFRLSGLEAELFSKQAGGLFSGQKIEIIEISKLADESGEKTVATEAFETNNLVLIDEGHRGVAGDQWKERRDILSQTGFAFEYSATFGQAVAASSAAKKVELLEEYGKSILFDYSYKYFHGDGYGKDYSILNVRDGENVDFLQVYLTGALLSYYQQHSLLTENPGWKHVYQLEKPLWVFVGSKVTAVRTENGRETSDVTEIIRFINVFVKDRQLSISIINRYLKKTDGILDANSRAVFDGRLSWLQSLGQTAEDIYDRILKTVFHSQISGSEVYADLLKNQDGEIGLRLGTGPYFGVINVGDASKLIRLLRSQGIGGDEKDFGASEFQTINKPDTTINLLVGSKKFTEGWSSWRVSTMGLMNIGAGEGSQIIQLFGRGVRLKGHAMSLKRSNKLDENQRPASHTVTDKSLRNLHYLETLLVFGIRANYMEQFRAFLEAEGLKNNDSVFESIEVPAIPTVNLGSVKLKVLQVKGDANFKGEPITLELSPKVGRESVQVEWYPRVQVLAGGNASQAVAALETHKLEEKHLAFIDWKRVFFEVQQFKNERGYFNLSISPKILESLIRQPSWYQLAIPQPELQADTFKRVKEWQEIVTALLKGYVERFYNVHKAGYFSKRMETVELTSDHPNFFQTYQIEIEKSRQDIIDNVTRLGNVVRDAEAPEIDENLLTGFRAFEFLQHLYKPLLYLDKRGLNDLVRVSPVALEASEEKFVLDLKHFYAQSPDFFKDRKLYVLRNASRKGIGFFEASGFYPDFIVWLVQGDHQYITFVDPKGLRQVSGFEHPKIRFYETIKRDIEPEVRVKDPNITLNSFIVTTTPFDDVKHWKGGERITDFNKHHVYFMDDQRMGYISDLMRKVVG